MWHPSSRSDGRRHLSGGSGDAAPTGSWLLVGNSRWHWAEAGPDGLSIRHRPAAESIQEHRAGPPAIWAAVGRLPAGWPAAAPGRVMTGDVPLQAMPAWLGVDRALAAWMAWCQTGEPVLVADAGTVLSLTRVDRNGRFAGGRLMAGLSLQLRAMAAGTAALPEAPSPQQFAALMTRVLWPQDTAAAMAAGVMQGLAAALAAALRQCRQDLSGCRLVLTGGDAATLLPLVQELHDGGERELRLEPDLALRGLVALRPAGGQEPQVRPRSAST